MPADDLPFVAPGAPVSRSGSVLLGSVCADRSLAVAATHSADHARTGLRCASCSDDCGGTTRNIDGRAPSPIPRAFRGHWPFWYLMYSGGGRRIALSNDARPGREDEKRAQMSTRAERSAISRGRGDIPALEKAHKPHTETLVSSGCVKGDAPRRGKDDMEKSNEDPTILMRRKALVYSPHLWSL